MRLRYGLVGAILCCDHVPKTIGCPADLPFFFPFIFSQIEEVPIELDEDRIDFERPLVPSPIQSVVVASEPHLADPDHFPFREILVSITPCQLSIVFDDNNNWEIVFGSLKLIFVATIQDVLSDF